MLELLKLYGWTIPAGAVFAAALALLGCQLAARERAMQIVCVSQGAMLGVIVALGVFQVLHHNDPNSHFGPFAFALLFSSVTYLATDALARRRSISKNALFASIFSMLLAGSYLASALFPALESHMAQIYFGDLATITEFDAKVTLVLGALSLGILITLWRPLTNQSFEIFSFGEAQSISGGRLWALAFNTLALAMLCFSVQFLGFLFTVATLFLPTTFLHYARSKGLRQHFVLASLTAGLGCVTGFMLSLQFTRLPTVPSIVMMQALFCLLWILLTQLTHLVLNKA